MSFINYIIQDHLLRFRDNSFTKSLTRYFRLSGYKIIVNYRMSQYAHTRWGGVKLVLAFLDFKLERICMRYGVTISASVKIGKGMSLPHGGPFVINNKAVIGDYCTLHPNVLIGGDRSKGTPIIGDYVFLGNGCKIIGNCKIGNWVFVSPGAVITKDIPDNSVVGFGLNNIINDNGYDHVNQYLR